MEELILIHFVHLLDDVVPDILEGNHIDEWMVINNNLLSRRAEIEMQGPGSTLDRCDDSFRIGIRIRVSPVEG